MSKKLLVLGTGPSQLDLVWAAKELDLKVFGCGMSASDDILNLLDGYKNINILDENLVEGYAREIEADFIFTMGMEKALPIVTNVSERLSLPNFFSSESLDKVEDKGVWRKTLGDIEGNLKFLVATDIEEIKDWDIYPAIIKPVDGSGQRGVHRVNDFDELKEVFNTSISYSRSKKVIVEEFATGEEISVNAFMYNNKLAFYMPSDRISYTEYPGGIIKEHHIPSILSVGECDDKVRKLVETVNQKMGFYNGHVYFQIKIDNNQPKLIEFTPRYDGCHMWRLIYLSTGIDLRKCSLKWLANNGRIEEFDEGKKFNLKKGKFKTKFISDAPGRIVKKSSYKLSENPLYRQWYYNDGDKVKKVTGYMEKVGFEMVNESEDSDK